MPLETGSYISDLVATNPAATDGVAQGDDHLRLIKSILKTTFPNLSGAMTATQAELNKLAGLATTQAELAKLSGATLTTAELNKLTGFTGTVTDLNKLAAITATAAEINKLAGLATTAAELGYLNGVTSAIQTQLNTLSSTLATKTTNSAAAITGGSANNMTLGLTTPAAAKVTDLTLTGGVLEGVQTVTGTTPSLDPANGTIKTWSLTGASTPTFALANGESFLLMIDDGTANTITWPTMTWVGGSAPTLALTGYTIVVVFRVAGVNYGVYAGDA